MKPKPIRLFSRAAVTLLVALLGSVTGAWAQSELTVYDGTDKNQYIPFNEYFADYGTRSQFIIPADKISEMAGGSISALKFYCTSSLANFDEEFTVYLKDNNFASGNTAGYCTVATGENGNCVWSINPINDNNYLGIDPEFTVGDKYYTTFYAGFAIQLSSGMKAYYVKEVKGKAAELVEIGSDIVPEMTPVIIEFSSNSPSSNKVTPLVSGGTKLTGNLLKGVYFSYVSLNGRRTAEDPNNKYYTKLKNALENKGTIRILGVVDGKLSLVKATEADLYMKKYLKANKAYLEVINTAESNLTLLEGDAYNEATGINSIRLNEESQGVYNLKGQKVPSTDDLPKGIYIIDGKKVTKN